VQDVFELQRNLNNAFAYDLVPSPSVVIAALRAARRVNDFPTAVRIFEGTFYMPAAAIISCALKEESRENSRLGNLLTPPLAQASTPRSRTRANTPSTSRSCRASGKSLASCSRRTSSPPARKLCNSSIAKQQLERRN
jgi:hypothetical protein